MNKQVHSHIGIQIKFKNFLAEYSIELLLPIWNLNSDWKRKDLLLMRGFVPKTLEPQCLVGVSLPEGKAPDKEVQEKDQLAEEKIEIPFMGINRRGMKKSLIVKINKYFFIWYVVKNPEKYK